MKHHFFYFVFMSLLLFGISSCQTKAQSTRVVETHNARTSIDWSGVYSGLIPSASGQGINVQLTLNSDGTFLLRYQYIDVYGVNSEFFYEKGTFNWNKTGSTVILDTKDYPNYYRLGEGILLQLDMEGNEIVSYHNHVLKKE